MISSNNPSWTDTVRFMRRIETQANTIVNVPELTKPLFGGQAFPTGIRRETAAEFLRQRPQAGNHVFGPAAPRIVQGTATERRVTGAKDHRAVDEVGIVSNTLT